MLKVADDFPALHEIERGRRSIVAPWLPEFECDIKTDDKSALILKKPVQFADHGAF